MKNLSILILSIFYFLCAINIGLSSAHGDHGECTGTIEISPDVNPEIKDKLHFEMFHIDVSYPDCRVRDKGQCTADGHCKVHKGDHKVYKVKMAGPEGANFEPNEYEFSSEKEDECTNLKFTFKGLNLINKISSQEKEPGPIDVGIGLYRKEENGDFKKILETKTSEAGAFEFDNIPHGDYEVRCENLKWKLVPGKELIRCKASVEEGVKCDWKTRIVVKGYNIEGGVQKVEEPFEDVIILLYGEMMKGGRVFDCEKEGFAGLINAIKYHDVYFKLVCSTKSKKDGEFRFSNIPPGFFVLSTLYKADPTIEIQPKFMEMVVVNKDIELNENFQVQVKSEEKVAETPKVDEDDYEELKEEDEERIKNEL